MDKETVERMGNNLEEFYFSRLNRELLQKLKRQEEEKLAAGKSEEGNFTLGAVGPKSAEN